MDAAFSRRRAVPVRFAGVNDDGIARDDLHRRLAEFLYANSSLHDQQPLRAVVCVPVQPRM